MVSKNKKVLGKGLSALIPEIDNAQEENIMEIDVQEIRPNDNQPRKIFDEEKLEELSQSILNHGVIQPLIAVKNPRGGYQIVAGERRWRAAVKAGVKKIPVIVKEIDDQEVMELALIENLQREDLNDIETAKAYKELMNKYGITQVEIAKQLGKSRVSITNTLRLLQLSDKIQKLINENKISAGHARAILSTPEDMRDKMADDILQHNLSVREAEDYSSKIKDKEKTSRNVDGQNNINKTYIKELEDDLQKILGTRVYIKQNKNKGKIEINYYSDNDLDRIINILNGQGSM